MYIDELKLTNFRTFQRETVSFLHPDQHFEPSPNATLPFPKPPFSNLNLLMGNNGAGKTTLLKAVAIACLGPAIEDVKLPLYRLIRREPGADMPAPEAHVEARFTTHPQDGQPEGALESRITLTALLDVERVRWADPVEKRWHPIFSAKSDAFFFVGYGAARHVESRDRVDLGARQTDSFVRAQRVRSLFEESYSLVPLSAWLPLLEIENPGRFTQVRRLIDRLLAHTGYTFTGEREQGEYLFEKNELRVPQPALSDGYRAFLGWIGDLLYHVCETCPSGKKLVENRGIVMVDEIDLHLHPKWQLTVLQTLAAALPNIQFILTSHSPLLVGRLEWMNILVMQTKTRQRSHAVRIPTAVHGLDADQILLSKFFELPSTRAPGKLRQVKQLALDARNGDSAAALALLAALSTGSESEG